MKFYILFAVLAFIVGAIASEKCPGCAEPMDKPEAKRILDETLMHLDSLEGPHYRSGFIHEASKQVVAGLLYKIRCDLIIDEAKLKTCNVEILKQSWTGNTKVEFKCPNEKDRIVSYHE
ncbi:cathepsin F-like [Haematobia irritans]|uniref:Putative sarcocystatin-a-like protein n=1 Tax=Haematobia irritans TaxID=7368 RepID=A0A1L8EFX2_HAEIR